jgi:hypothetical protein
MHDLFAQDCWNASSFACALCLHLVRKRGYMQMQIGMLAGDSLSCVLVDQFMGNGPRRIGQPVFLGGPRIPPGGGPTRTQVPSVQRSLASWVNLTVTTTRGRCASSFFPPNGFIPHASVFLSPFFPLPQMPPPPHH